MLSIEAGIRGSYLHLVILSKKIEFCVDSVGRRGEFSKINKINYEVVAGGLIHLSSGRANCNMPKMSHTPFIEVYQDGNKHPPPPCPEVTLVYEIILMTVSGEGETRVDINKTEDRFRN